MGDAQAREWADELVTSVADDSVVGTQRCPQRVCDLAQHSVTSSVTQRVVDRFEVVDVDERKRERLFRPLRPSDLAFQFDDSGSAQVRTCEIVHGRLLALGRRRTAIGERRVTVSLGLTAFGGPCPAISQRRVTVKLGFTAFAGSCPTILPGSIPVEGGLAPIRRRSLGLRGDFIPLVSGSVALVTRLISPLGDVVPAVSGSVTLVTRLIAPLGHIVPTLARQIAFVTRLIAMLSGIVPAVGRPIAFVGGHRSLIVATDGCPRIVAVEVLHNV
jgi:hypothetical protein